MNLSDAVVARVLEKRASAASYYVMQKQAAAYHYMEKEAIAPLLLGAAGLVRALPWAVKGLSKLPFLKTAIPGAMKWLGTKGTQLLGKSNFGQGFIRGVASKAPIGRGFATRHALKGVQHVPIKGGMGRFSMYGPENLKGVASSHMWGQRVGRAINPNQWGAYPKAVLDTTVTLGSVAPFVYGGNSNSTPTSTIAPPVQ